MARAFVTALAHSRKRRRMPRTNQPIILPAMKRTLILLGFLAFDPSVADTATEVLKWLLQL